MQIPPSEPIPSFPDDTTPGPVPPIGPGEIEPDEEDSPLPGDEPGEEPDFPPGRNPFPDDVDPPASHPQSL